MKNNLVFVLICSVAFTALSYGILAGTFELFPYEIYNKAKQITFSELDRNYPDKEDYIRSTNPSKLIKIENESDLLDKRNKLIKFIWKENTIPQTLPNKITKDIVSSKYDYISNLKQIDKLNIKMEYEVNSIVYHFVPKESNNSIILYHQGHGGDFYMGRDSIEYFINNGYDVLAFSMPLYGMNNKPIVETDFGTIKLIEHEHFRFLETESFTPMKFFVDPISRSLNYIEQEYNFEKYYMVGLSGGGLMTVIYPALDERISESFSIAGSYPIYLEATKKSPGHYEYLNMDFYQISNYLELYTMASYGQDRKLVQIFNEFDLCCYEETWYETYENDVKNKISSLGKGEFHIYLDSTHKEHKISEYALEIINDSITNVTKNN